MLSEQLEHAALVGYGLGLVGATVHPQDGPSDAAISLARLAGERIQPGDQPRQRGPAG